MPRPHRLFYGLAFGLALMMTGLFTVRAVHRFSHLRSGADEPIRPWMNVPYIARAYGVPPEILFDALGIAPENEKRRPRPIEAIARSQNRPVSLLIDELQMAIDRYHLPPPPPSPPVPATPVPPATPVLPEGNS